MTEELDSNPRMQIAVKNESKVRALRIMSWDKYKGRHNWKAIKLTEVNFNE